MSEQNIKAASLDNYSTEDRDFFAFWYSHMQDDVMQPPLAGIWHSTARYIWDAARRTAPVSAPLDTQALPPPGLSIAHAELSERLGREVAENLSLRMENRQQAERIRHLERELAERKPASIGRDRDFWKRMYEWREAWLTGPAERLTRAADDLIAYIDGRTAGTAPLDPVEGDLLPPVGSRVLIHLGRQDAWIEHTVTGYYVWCALSHQVREGEKNSHRVFVRVKDANGYDNARLLSEVRIAAAPSPLNSGKEEA